MDVGAEGGDETKVVKAVTVHCLEMKTEEAKWGDNDRLKLNYEKPNLHSER